MEDKKKRNLDRRAFLKMLGGGAVASIAAIYGGLPASANASPGRFSNGALDVDNMTYRTNPKTGDKVALLGYGCMRFPKRKGGNEIDQDIANMLVDYAMAHGVNYYDTSPVYSNGTSEKVVGIALSRHPRNKYFVATKMSNMHDTDKEASLEMYHNSMKDLQVDYIDYYLLHSLRRYEDYKKRFLDNGVLDFLLKEREAGRIRNLGWSFHGNKELFDYMLSSGVKWDFVQIQLNYLDWKNPDTGKNAHLLYTELAKRNIPVVVMEPLRGGRLADVESTYQTIMKNANPDESVASWAFRFAGSFPNVLTVLSGMTCMEHLQDNLKTFSPLHVLSEKDTTMLLDIADSMRGRHLINCTACQYCMPCPFGVDIPGVFAYYNKGVRDKIVVTDTNDPNYKEAGRKFLDGLNGQIAKEHLPNHCIACGACLPKCPQALPIPDNMKKINKLVDQLKKITTV